LGEYESRTDDIAGAARAGGGVAQGVPTPGEQSKAAFTEATQGSQKRVVGAVVDSGPATIGWLLDRRVDTVAAPS
jgi:hypothetical protein